MHRLPPRPGLYGGFGACQGIFFGISVLAPPL
jgi:hypothetical protein